MLTMQRPSAGVQSDHRDNHHQEDDQQVRDIHALTPPNGATASRSRWDQTSRRSSSMSITSEAGGSSTENFTTMSREFNALVIAGSSIDDNSNNNNSDMLANGDNQYLSRIGEDDDHDHEVETNPLAIVPDNSSPLDPGPDRVRVGVGLAGGGNGEVAAQSVQRVKREEVETKITAWQNAKVAKVNNRFKRDDAIINGWESEQVQKATSWMKKVERKLEEKRARALEKMQNDVAKAHRKAEERRASAEAKRGTKVARVLEIANLMRAVGRPPVKRSFF